MSRMIWGVAVLVGMAGPGWAQTAPMAMVALTMDGKPLEAEGAFRLVVAGEKKPARWVRNLAALTVVTVE